MQTDLNVVPLIKGTYGHVAWDGHITWDGQVTQDGHTTRDTHCFTSCCGQTLLKAHAQPPLALLRTCRQAEVQNPKDELGCWTQVMENIGTRRHSLSEVVAAEA